MQHSAFLLMASLLTACSSLQERHEAVQFQIRAHHECMWGKERFLTDSIKDSVCYYVAGPSGYGDTYPRLMRERYGVHIVMTDLFGLHADMSCYNQLSEPYIKRQFGDSVMIKVRKEAEQLDRTGLGDRPPFYTDKSDSFERYFFERIDPVYYRHYYDFRGSFQGYGYLFIDSTGLIKDMQFSSVRGGPLDSLFSILGPGLPLLAQPATDDGKPCEGTMMFVLGFSPASEQIYIDHHSQRIESER